MTRVAKFSRFFGAWRLNHIHCGAGVVRPPAEIACPASMWGNRLPGGRAGVAKQPLFKSTKQLFIKTLEYVFAVAACRLNQCCLACGRVREPLNIILIALASLCFAKKCLFTRCTCGNCALLFFLDFSADEILPSRISLS